VPSNTDTIKQVSINCCRVTVR